MEYIYRVKQILNTSIDGIITEYHFNQIVTHIDAIDQNSSRRVSGPVCPRGSFLEICRQIIPLQDNAFLRFLASFEDSSPEADALAVHTCVKVSVFTNTQFWPCNLERLLRNLIYRQLAKHLASGGDPLKDSAPRVMSRFIKVDAMLVGRQVVGGAGETRVPGAAHACTARRGRGVQMVPLHLPALITVFMPSSCAVWMMASI